jgi:hypothetical protein
MLDMRRSIILFTGILCLLCGIANAGLQDDISKHIYLSLDAPKRPVFVNEKVPIALNLYSDRFSISLVSLTKIKSDDLIVEEFYASEGDMVKQDGITYRLVRYLTSFIAPLPGKFVIKSITAKIDFTGDNKDDMLAYINNNEEFYENFIGKSGNKSMELRTDPVDITVVPLPREGKPDDFSGAIGEFSFELSVSPDEVKPGEEIKLKMIIKGVGNYSTVSVPRMKKTAGIKWYEPRIMKGENTVTYEQSIRVRSSDVREIPEASFNFFSPETGKYVSITKGPISIRVAAAAPGETKTAGKLGEPEIKKEWIDSLKEPVGPLQERTTPFYLGGTFLLFETFPILIVIAGCIAYTVVRYLEEHPLYTASFAASRKARKGIINAESMLGKKSPKEFYGFIFRILQGYLGMRRLKPTEGITSNIIDEIDTSGIEQEVVENIRKVFYECYVGIYTKEVLGKDDMRDTLDALIFVVDRLDKRAEL